jgi:hypothetical protein
LKEGVV